MLTCRCRHCGYSLCYSADNVGADARCSNCGETIRLPGKLSAVAGINRTRRTDRAGLAMEIGGFLMMFFVYPFGLIGGAVIVYLGWRRCTVLVCSNCNSIVPSRDEDKCTGCNSSFGSE